MGDISVVGPIRNSAGVIVTPSTVVGPDGAVVCLVGTDGILDIALNPISIIEFEFYITAPSSGVESIVIDVGQTEPGILGWSGSLLIEELNVTT